MQEAYSILPSKFRKNTRDGGLYPLNPFAFAWAAMKTFKNG